MPAERRQQLKAEYRTNGLTMAALAKREGIKYQTFVGWMAKSPATPAPKPPIRFAEMRLPLPAVPAGLQHDYAVEVRLPDGTDVRGRAAAEVVALVRGLRR